MTGDERQALRTRHSHTATVLQASATYGFSVSCPACGNPHPCVVLQCLDEFDEALVILQDVDTLLLNLYVNDVTAPHTAHLTQTVKGFLKRSQSTATLETST